jgi:uncharacterized repeat protein (TIGR01451 family)
MRRLGLKGTGRGALLAIMTAGLVAGGLTGAQADHGGQLDPAQNGPLPCEQLPVGFQGLPARSENRIVHLANRCGIVGTDIEFQSRKDSTGAVHDYAFVGTMGAGFRIFDVTNPADPVRVGGFIDSGWENDLQVRGNLVVNTFDGVNGEPSSLSKCLKTHYPTSLDQGIDLFRLHFDPQKARTKATGTFSIDNHDCVANPPGGAHNVTIHPSGKFLMISNCCSDWAIDVVDLRGPDPVNTFRLIDESKVGTSQNNHPRCPANGRPVCITMRRPLSGLGSSKSDVPCIPDTACTGPRSAWGLWRPHDVFFSRDGKTMYVAAINSTWIVGIGDVLNGNVKPLSIIPNNACPQSGGCGDNPNVPLDVNNPQNISISHQADTTPDGNILIISDERGGGLTETSCNTDEHGDVIGALHFWALHELPNTPRSAGATPSTPKRLGAYFFPNPGLLSETVIGGVIGQLADERRLERACTIHVFRIGGNGTSSPGPIQAGFDGVSSQGPRVLVSAAYGAGVWRVNFANPTLPDIPGTDKIEDDDSTWGNTLGWNVQVGADTWSAKEYKGFIFAADILRGFDVYACTSGETGCPRDPIVTTSMKGPATASRGTLITYKISYDNHGPAASSNARITDALPADLEFVSAGVVKGDLNGAVFDGATRTVTWKLGTVGVNESGTVELVARVKDTADAAITNVAHFIGDKTVANPSAAVTTVLQ